MSESLAGINEEISCVATTDDYGKVTGISGAYGYNISLLNEWGRGNFHGFKGVSINSRDARRFSNAVRYAEDKHLIGKRSAFSCAEVNAVTRLLANGAPLQQIQIWGAKGADGRRVKTCDACRCWKEMLWQS